MHDIIYTTAQNKKTDDENPALGCRNKEATTDSRFGSKLFQEYSFRSEHLSTEAKRALRQASALG